MKHDDEEYFRSFVAERSAALLRSAYLIVGDRGRAEDLLQTALAKTYSSWGRIRDRGALEAYVRRTMVTTATSWWRGRRFREHLVEELPAGRVAVDHPGGDIDAVVERDAMWRRLAMLPVRQRAVMVLRYYEGLTESEIADILDISRGSVKSHASRAMASLRANIPPMEPEVAA